MITNFTRTISQKSSISLYFVFPLKEPRPFLAGGGGQPRHTRAGATVCCVLKPAVTTLSNYCPASKSVAVMMKFL